MRKGKRIEAYASCLHNGLVSISFIFTSLPIPVLENDVKDEMQLVPVGAGVRLDALDGD